MDLIYSTKLTQKLNDLRKSIFNLPYSPYKESLYQMLESLEEALEKEEEDRHYQKLADDVHDEYLRDLED